MKLILAQNVHFYKLSNASCNIYHAVPAPKPTISTMNVARTTNHGCKFSEADLEAQVCSFKVSTSDLKAKDRNDGVEILECVLCRMPLLQEN